MVGIARDVVDTFQSGGAGAFTWMTYKKVHQLALDLASGVAQLGLPAKSTFGMYSANSARFQIISLGMMSQVMNRLISPIALIALIASPSA